MSESVYQYDCPECGNDRPTMTKRARESYAGPQESHPWDNKQIFHCEDCGKRWVV